MVGTKDAISQQQEAVIWRRFLRPVEVGVWAFVVVTLLLVLWLPMPSAERWQAASVPLMAGAYILVVFRWLLPRFGPRLWVHYTVMLLNVSIVAAGQYILGPHEIHVDMFFVVVVALTGIMATRAVALVAALLSTVAYGVISLLWYGLSPSVVLHTALHLLAFVITAYLTSSLVGIIRRQASDADQRSRELTFLRDTSAVAAASMDLNTSLPQLAEKIAEGLPATFCRICLLDTEGKDLVTYGASPLRPLEGWEPRLGERCPVEDLPMHRKALAAGQTVIIRQDDPATAMDDKERALLFFNGVKSACLVPLVAVGRTLGVICVGEERRWERQPFSQETLDLLQTLAAEVAVVIRSAQLHETVVQQAERMAVLNEVARAIGSTIEMENLLELIYQQLSQVIRTDTYFVSLYIPEEEAMDLRILIDDGQRFPPAKIPVGQGLASLVIRTRQPLLLRHVTQEVASLPVKPIVMGQAKMSESWLGVPMMVSDQPMGLLAIASYEPHAFGEDDVALLSNIAGQAALALDNARRHAQAVEQARRDSLTGVYNHSHLVNRLREEVERARAEGKPVSMIMLDIDDFKKYNDRYGHVVGDEVLRLAVQAMEAHVKKTDVVGRWGGEEFGIVLPGASTEQAYQVAERIRQTLADLPLTDSNGQPLPKPTVSQGIATFPDHVPGADELVVSADRALYVAKEAGRDQVRVTEMVAG